MACAGGHILTRKYIVAALFAMLVLLSSVFVMFSMVQLQPQAYVLAANPENPRQADGSEAATVAAGSKCSPGSGGLPLPTWYQYLPGKNTAGGCQINTEGLGGKVIILILMAVFDMLMYIAGVVAVVMVIWGGFKLLTSSGEPQKIAAARTTIFNALVGLVIAIIASQIVGFIAGGLA